MISNEDVKQALKSQKAIKVIPTDAKRVVIVLPKGIVGKNVEYVDWNGKKCKGEGFLFFNWLKYIFYYSFYPLLLIHTFRSQ